MSPLSTKITIIFLPSVAKHIMRYLTKEKIKISLKNRGKESVLKSCIQWSPPMVSHIRKSAINFSEFSVNFESSFQLFSFRSFNRLFSEIYLLFSLFEYQTTKSKPKRFEGRFASSLMQIAIHFTSQTSLGLSNDCVNRR